MLGEPALTRVLLFTGKGGVGKTSVAAATAARAAAAGRRVLVTSTDPAHSLADVLDHPLGDHPSAVPTGPGTALHAQQIDTQARLERHWRHVRDYLVAVLARTGLGSVQAEELSILPGLDELFALVDLDRQVAAGDYDLVVVDCAPTAETLRLLGLPDALSWYVDRVVGPGRRVARAVRPVVRGLGADTLPVPDDDVFATVERVHADLASVHALLQDPARSSIRLVLNAERVVVAESQRTATALSLFGYAVDAVVVNRLLPDEVRDPYFGSWLTRQEQLLDEVRTGFAPTPVLTAPLLADEPIGTDRLVALAQALYADTDEAAVLSEQRPVHVRDEGAGHVLSVAVPFATQDDVELHRRGADLHIRVGGAKRTVALPAALRRCDITGAQLNEGRLELYFAPRVEEAVT